MRARFLSRLTPVLTEALGPMVLTYAALVFVADVPVLSEWPFGVAMGIGGLVAARTGLRLYRDASWIVDEHGLEDPGRGLRLRWAEVRQIVLEVAQVDLGEGRVASFRVARFVGDENQLAVADFGPGMPGRVGDAVNLEGAGLILAAVASQTGADLGPPSWHDGERSTVAAAPLVTHRPRSRDAAGLAALGMKLVPKAGSIALKLAKTIKPGAALATVGVYSLLFSWKFAVALVGMVAVHECGHVYAMWRSGVDVRGIYFIPFFGGAAVSNGVAKTHANSAYIAINGPVWGLALALLCLVGFWLTQWTPLAALAAWGALLNLFNLLPIYPLDGGRLLSSLANAGFGVAGMVAVLGSLSLGALLGYVSGLELLTLMAIIGLGEWGGHVAAAPYRPGIRLLGARPYGVDEQLWFHDLVRPVAMAAATEEAIEARREGHERRLALAKREPMTPRQGLYVLLAYLGVAGALVMLLLATTGLEGAGDPLSLLE